MKLILNKSIRVFHRNQMPEDIVKKTEYYSIESLLEMIINLLNADKSYVYSLEMDVDENGR